MIKEEDYLKAKQIVQEYEKQLNISDVSNNEESVCEEADDAHPCYYCTKITDCKKCPFYSEQTDY